MTADDHVLMRYFALEGIIREVALGERRDIAGIVLQRIVPEGGDETLPGSSFIISRR